MLIQCRCNFSTVSQYMSWLNLDNEPTAIKYQLSLARRGCTRLTEQNPSCVPVLMQKKGSKRGKKIKKLIYTQNISKWWGTLWVATSPGHRNHRQQAFISVPSSAPSAVLTSVANVGWEVLSVKCHSVDLRPWLAASDIPNLSVWEGHHLCQDIWLHYDTPRCLIKLILNHQSSGGTGWPSLSTFWYWKHLQSL